MSFNTIRERIDITYYINIGFVKINSLMREKFVFSSAALKEDLTMAYKILICLDLW